MSCKMSKTKKNDKLFYLIADGEKRDTYYDFFEFPHPDNLPIIETVTFKRMGKELLEMFLNKKYNSSNFRSIIFLRLGLIIDKNKLDVSTLHKLNDVVNSIRFQDLYNIINSFRKNVTVAILEWFFTKILAIKSSDLSKKTQELFENFIVDINYTKDKEVLFKEILFLTIISEYEKAIAKQTKLEEEYKEWAEENPETEEDLQNY